MSGKRKDYISFEELFMNIALLSAKRSKDPRTQVGATLVDSENKILSIGYNGTPLGMNDDLFPWDSLGEETGNLLQIKNTFVVHAESNAIANFSGDKTRLQGSTLYVTLFPCNECAKLIIQNKIKRVIYYEMYSKKQFVEATKMMFDLANVEYLSYDELMKKQHLDKKEKIKIRKRW